MKTQGILTVAFTVFVAALSHAENNPAPEAKAGTEAWNDPIFKESASPTSRPKASPTPRSDYSDHRARLSRAKKAKKKEEAEKHDLNVQINADIPRIQETPPRQLDTKSFDIELALDPWSNLAFSRTSFNGPMTYQKDPWPGVEGGFQLPVSTGEYGTLRIGAAMGLASYRRQANITAGVISFQATQSLFLFSLPMQLTWEPAAWSRNKLKFNVGVIAAPLWGVAGETELGDTDSFGGFAGKLGLGATYSTSSRPDALRILANLNGGPTYAGGTTSFAMGLQTGVLF